MACIAKMKYLQQQYSFHSEHTELCPVDLIVTECEVSMCGAHSYHSNFFHWTCGWSSQISKLEITTISLLPWSPNSLICILCFQSILSSIIHPIYAFRTYWRRLSHRFWSHQKSASRRQTLHQPLLSYNIHPLIGHSCIFFKFSHPSSLYSSVVDR